VKLTILESAQQMALDEDEALMLQVVNGEKSAFERLVIKHSKTFHLLAARMLGDSEQARDIVQTGFLKVWKNKEKWKPSAKFSTWFHTIIYNLCTDMLRKRKHFKVEWDENSGLKNFSHNSENAQLQSEVAQKVKNCLQKLTIEQRGAIILTYYQGLTNKVSAEILGVTVSNLETILYRGRKKLKSLLIVYKD